MKNIKKMTVSMTSLLIVFIFLTGNMRAVMASDNDSANRMNVVFVLDESGSMSKTDANALRYEAVDLFLGIATETGNYMGAIAFDDGIILKKDIKEIAGKDSKGELSDCIRSTHSHGDTDIGKAVELASQMLMEDKNNSLPSAIILLSDGNTDLPKDTTGEALEASIASRINAIDIARNNGIKIYSVCLNTNGEADKKELQEISDATGGACVEVKSAEDLKEVFSQFYGMIYSTDTVNLADTFIPEGGELEIPFEIPMLGVEEANIIINTLNIDTNYNLSNPRGYGYTQAEMQDMEIKAKTFTIIKIQKPEDGKWKLIVRGIAGDRVTIDMVYNSDLVLKVGTSVLDESVWADDNIEITAQLFNSGDVIEDKTIYQTYSFNLIINNTKTEVISEEKMEAGENCSKYVLQPSQYGNLEIQAYCNIDKMMVKSDVVPLSIGNTAPVSSKSAIKISKLITPFSDEIYVEDLSIFITDEEDAELTYSISDSDFDADMVVIDSSCLNIRIKECGNGELIVTATDSGGETVDVPILIKTQNLLTMLVYILVPVVLFLLVVLAIFKIRKNSKMIRGRIRISGYTEDGFLGTPKTFDGNRGKMLLSRYLDYREDVGINLAQTYLIAGERESCIYLVSKAGYYTDVSPSDKSKRICLDAEDERNISSDTNFGKGIKVTYIPHNMEY